MRQPSMEVMVARSLDELFRKTQHLPVIPEVVRDLMRSFGDETLSIGEVGRRIAMDQVLLARSLRLANSGRYAAERKVVVIEDAIMALGLGVVKTLVIASGLANGFSTPPGFDLRRFWRGNLAIAGYAQWLAKRAGVREDLAFTGGLVLNIGGFLLQMHSPVARALLSQSADSAFDRCAAERRLFGFTHADVSAELARRWDFPAEIVAAFAHYPSPWAAASFNRLGGIFHVAEHVSRRWLANGNRDEVRVDLPSQVLQSLGEMDEVFLAELPPLQDMVAGLEDLLN